MENLTYRPHGDYLMPELTLSTQPEGTPLPDGVRLPDEPLGKYALMRRSYLKDQRPILFNSLVLSEQLHPHLQEIDRTANIRLMELMTRLTSQNPPPDKAADQMAWAAHMNSLKQQAEELILTELIYS